MLHVAFSIGMCRQRSSLPAHSRLHLLYCVWWCIFVWDLDHLLRRSPVLSPFRVLPCRSPCCPTLSLASLRSCPYYSLLTACRSFSMRVYIDVITGEELFSDAYPMKTICTMRSKARWVFEFDDICLVCSWPLSVLDCHFKSRE
jgi:hypothetical protein